MSDAAARQHLAVASDIKRYALTVLKSAARPAIRRLAMESVFMSLVADGVPLEGMADFCTAELEAYMAQAAGAT